MYYLKPSWLAHSEENKKFEIYSLHVHPDGSRLASGGLDGKVRIWSTETVYECAGKGGNGEPEDAGAVKQLCSMSTHSGAVTVVRFSPSGRFLASGSDDRIILIWERDEEAQGVPRKEFGSQGEAETERWAVKRRCVGHENDVQDLAWAPDSSILVSVALDSGIIIWSGSTFEKIKRLDVHQSHVKGISFDPANKYFATASDDRTIKIFRYHRTSQSDMQFSLETTVTAPFEGSPLTTYFRRCSWSPDGSHIAAANSTNGPVATVAIVNRGIWDSEIHLIGHEGPVEVAAFSPRMFSKAKGSKQLVTVIACAGQDKALSVWNTSNPRPIIVAQNISEKAITDLAWSPDGQKLFASSLDGTILVCVFEEGDLGYIIPVEENEKQLAKYGGGRDNMHFPESVHQLALEDKAAVKEAEQSKDKMDLIMEGERAASTGTPATIASASVPAAPAPAPAPVVAKPVAQPTTAKPLAAQRVTITKDGKKRVTPQLVSFSGAPAAGNFAQAPQLAALPTAGAGPVAEFSRPSDRLPPGGVAALVVGTKHRVKADELEEPDPKRVALLGGARATDVPEFIRPAVIAPAVAVSQLRLGVPKVRAFLSLQPDKSSLVFEARNGAGDRAPTKITLSKRGQVFWTDFLPKMALLMTGNTAFWAVACEDGSVVVYSPAGRRLLPPLVLDANPCFLESKGSFLMCVTSTGMLYVWNVDTLAACHPPVSTAPIFDAASQTDTALHKAVAIVSCGITVAGSVIVSLSNGSAYTYSRDMLCWHRISESWWAVGSQYWDSSGVRRQGDLISMTEWRTDEEVKRAGRGRFLQSMVKSALMVDGYEGIETTVSIAHLETRIGTAILLGARKELKTFLLMYARRMAEEGMKDRLEELCRELMGPMIANDAADAAALKSEAGYADDLCGLNKRALLKEIISLIGKQREIQRITVPYAQLLGLLDDLEVPL
ncbi:TUP1-like enhancer of split-domain-containing protein [Dipodascopsis tothii]|uniref:TUP1-like enhancer of split-domain-containing protein n=1 Tax=Dipodascopsis tothii TaxID=44089 RepID=UPI0034CD0B22